MIRVWITVAIITSIGALGWYGYSYVNNLQQDLIAAQADLVTAKANEVILKDSLASASRAIANYQKDVMARDAVIAAISDRFAEFRAEADQTTVRIDSTNFTNWPADGINAISRDQLRCIEVASGAPITEVVSNPECPKLIPGKE